MQDIYYISDAAKEVQVESHVLRYWEEELKLPIGRNELGHRYYTQENIETFKQIKELKERGLQLKAIKRIMKTGKVDSLGREEFLLGEDNREELGIEITEGEKAVASEYDEKVAKLRVFMQQMIREVVEENNDRLAKDIREYVVKELDYQFRMQEEQAEAREKRLAERDEAYYKKMDELLRTKASRKWLLFGKGQKTEKPAAT